MKPTVLCVILGMIFAPFNARADAAALFVQALEACATFYETLDPGAFSEWLQAREYKAACASCTTRSGRYEDPETGAFIEVNHTFQGTHVGVDCSFRINQRLETAAPIEAWAKRGLESGRLQMISRPLFPGERLRACARPSKPLAIQVILRQSNAQFNARSGQSTGGTPAPAICQ